jgi:hypothetical protein
MKFNSNNLHNINSKSWWFSQPVNKWLDIADIPSFIFKSIWYRIEQKNVNLHPTEAKYLITYHKADDLH